MWNSSPDTLPHPEGYCLPVSFTPPPGYWGSLALWSSYFEFLFWSEFHFYFLALVSSGRFAIYLLNDTGVVLGCGVV